MNILVVLELVWNETLTQQQFGAPGRSFGDTGHTIDQGEMILRRAIEDPENV